MEIEMISGLKMSSKRTLADSIEHVALKISKAADDFEYEIYGDNAVITEYIGQGKEVRMPKMIEEKTVTEIGDYAFAIVKKGEYGFLQFQKFKDIPKWTVQ